MMTLCKHKNDVRGRAEFFRAVCQQFIDISMPLAAPAAQRLKAHDDTQRVARHDHIAETGIVDAAKEGVFPFVLRQRQDSDDPRLGYGFHYEDAGHDGLARKMPCEIVFVLPHALYRDDALPRDKFLDLIDQQKRFALRNYLLYLFNIKHLLFALIFALLSALTDH